MTDSLRLARFVEVNHDFLHDAERFHQFVASVLTQKNATEGLKREHEFNVIELL